MRRRIGTTWAMHLLACTRKGMEAHASGLKESDCPYKGFKGLNRQRRNYWQKGWVEAEERKMLATTCFICGDPALSKTYGSDPRCGRHWDV